MIDAVQLELTTSVKITFSPGEREAFRRKNPPPLFDFAEKYIVVPMGGKQGPFRREYVPHLALPGGPVEVFDRGTARYIFYTSTPRSAKSMFAQICHFHRIKFRPDASLVIMNIQKNIGKMSRDYVQPMLRASPKLRSLLPKERDDVGKDRIRFTNGHRIDLTFHGRIEMIGYPTVIGEETKDWPAGRVFTAKKRMDEYDDALGIFTSSITGEGGNWREMKDCHSLLTIFFTCPECGVEQVPVFGSPDEDDQDTPGVKFPSYVTEPSIIEMDNLAMYRCANDDCGHLMDEKEFASRITPGHAEWIEVEKSFLGYVTDDDGKANIDPFKYEDPFPKRVENPHPDPLDVGFLTPFAPCSPLVKLSTMAAQFLASSREKDPDRREQLLREWYQEQRNRPYARKVKSDYKTTDILKLRDEREVDPLTAAAPVPDEALVIVAFADTQDNGLWYELRAFDEFKNSWGLGYNFIPKSPQKNINDDFEALMDIVNRQYFDESGRTMFVQLVGNDFGGHRPDAVKAFAWKDPRRFMPTKGHHLPIIEMFKPMKLFKDPVSNKVIEGAPKAMLFDPNAYKDRLSTALATPAGVPGHWALAKHYGNDYAAQMCAEARDDATGQWTLIGSRANHLWDCGVGCLVVYDILVRQGTIARLAAEGKGPPPEEEAKRKAVSLAVDQNKPTMNTNPRAGRNLNPRARS